MALRVYLVPKIETATPFLAFRPAYMTDGAVAAGLAAVIDYGAEAWMIVFADTTAGEHAAIVAHADVTVLPANLDNQIGAALATVQGKLEAANFPADWVTSAMTYRTMLKWVLRICFLMQRFQHFGDVAERFFAAVTLDSVVGDLSVAMRQHLQSATESLGLDMSSITLGTTIRSALRILGQQMTFTVTLGGESA